MMIYLGMGLMLAIVAGIVVSAFGSKEDTKIVSMDDLGSVEVKKSDGGKSKKGKKIAEQL